MLVVFNSKMNYTLVKFLVNIETCVIHSCSESSVKPILTKSYEVHEGNEEYN